MSKVLFVYNVEMSTFIRRDLEILKKGFEVRVVRYRGIADLPRILRGVLWCNLSFCWFASLHSFYAVVLSRIFRRKTVVVAGGYDVARCPQIKYGITFFRWKRWCSVLTLRLASLVLTISEANTSEAIENAKADSSKTTLVYLGFDADHYKPDPQVPKGTIVLTVGAVSKSNLLRKGLEAFVRSSLLLPHFEFILAGRWMDDSVRGLQAVGASNLRFINDPDDQALLNIFRRSKVYVQASHHEAFGCSVAEAMLCECVPVVSKTAALPEVVGDCGFYLTTQEPEELAGSIKKALNSDDRLGRRARERIKTLFPLEKREKTLLEILKQLVD